MKQLINEIYEIIKDYRQEEGKMSIDRIEKWITQFEGADREFILNELISIFRQRYFSKSKIIDGIELMFNEVSQRLGHADTKDFLKVSSFIDHQPEGKSQKELLTLLKEISIKKFGINLTDQNQLNLSTLFI